MIISGNLGYSWWTHPIAIKHGELDNVLYGGVLDSGNPRVYEKQHWDNSVSDIQHVQLYDAQEADDHNSVTVVSDEDKPTLVFWQRHGKSPFLNYWKSTGGTLALGDKQTITYPENITYNQALYYGNTIMVMSRVGTSGWGFVVSTDWGDTWSAPKTLFDGSAYGGQIYLTTAPVDGQKGKYHLAAYGHPTSSPWREVIYGEIDMTTGDITNEGTVVGNILNDTNLPLNTTSLTTAWSPNPNVAGEKVRLLDVGGKHGKPAVLLAKWNDNTQTPQYYVAYRDDNGQWVNFKYRSSGGVFDDGIGRKYTYGMCFDRNNRNFLYMAYKDGGTYYLKRYIVNSDFTLSGEKSIDASSTPIARPYAPINGDGVIYQLLTKYNSYTDYKIELRYGG